MSATPSRQSDAKREMRVLSVLTVLRAERVSFSSRAPVYSAQVQRFHRRVAEAIVDDLFPGES